MFALGRRTTFQLPLRSFHTSPHRLAEQENHYERLKLPIDASLAEIKNKFKKISLKLHPDMLKSQGLSDDELSKKADQYLKVKRSYEVLSDDKKRNEYDLHMGIRRRDPGSSSPNSFFKRPGNSFHFHEQYRYNDVPHFDSKKHQERSERVEKMYVYNQKINQNIDTFGRDLYARNLGKNGPRKGIYKEYTYQPNIRDDESEGKKMAMKIAGGVIGIFALWYMLAGNYSTEKTKTKKTSIDVKTLSPPPAVEKPKAGEDAKEDDGVRDTMIREAAADVAATMIKENAKREEINSVSKSGNKMSVNNSYGMMLIGGVGSSKRSDLEILEEQISETSE